MTIIFNNISIFFKEFYFSLSSEIIEEIFYKFFIYVYVCNIIYCLDLQKNKEDNENLYRQFLPDISKDDNIKISFTIKFGIWRYITISQREKERNKEEKNNILEVSNLTIDNHHILQKQGNIIHIQIHIHIQHLYVIVSILESSQNILIYYNIEGI